MNSKATTKNTDEDTGIIHKKQGVPEDLDELQNTQSLEDLAAGVRVEVKPEIGAFKNSESDADNG